MIIGVAFALTFVVVAGADIPGPTPEPGIVERYAAHRASQDARALWLLELNGPYIAPAPPVHTHALAPRVDTTGVEEWRVLAAEWFLADKVDEALAIIQCESGGDPSIPNPTSSALGLWQFLKGWYAGKWSSVVGMFDPRDPVASMRAAAIVSRGGSDWGDWAASRHCHGL